MISSVGAHSIAGSLRIRSVGQLAITSGTEDLDLGLKPCLLLLIIAASRSKSAKRSELLDLLWPSSEPRRARHSLSQAIHEIKSKIVGDVLSSDDEDVRLTCSIDWDYAFLMSGLRENPSFESLRKVKGDFLEGVFVDGSNAFEDWRYRLSADLRNEVFGAFSTWITTAIVRAEWRKIGEISRHLCSVLNTEIEEILEAEGPIRVAVACMEGRPHFINARPTVNSTSLVHLPLIGRSDEIRHLLTCYAQASAGALTHVAIIGEAGIGKTRLATAILEGLVIRGAEPIHVRCYENEQSSGVTNIAAALKNSSALQVVDALPQPWNGVIRSLFDERSVGFDKMISDERQEFVLEALARLFEQLASRQPVVLFVDDLQWGSSLLLEFIAHLSRGRHRCCILVITATRDDVSARRTFEARLNGRCYHEMRLKPLTEQDLRMFAERGDVDGFPEDATRAARELYERTAGHPYLLNEVLRAIEKSGTFDWSASNIRSATKESVSDYVTYRLAAVSAVARHLLNTVTVLGKPTRFDVVRRVSGMRSSPFLAALQELRSRGLVLDTDGLLESKHDLIRQSVYEDLSVSQRRMLHRRAARALEHFQRPPFELVKHYMRAGLRSRTYISSLRAATASERGGANSDCSVYLQHAHRTCASDRKRIALKWRIADHAFHRNWMGTASKLYQELLRTTSLPIRRRACAEVRVLEAAYFTGAINSSLQISAWEDFLSRSATPDTIEYHVLALRALARLYVQNGNRQGMQVICDKLDRVLDSYTSSDAAIEALRWKAQLLLILGHKEAARDSLHLAWLRVAQITNDRLVAEVSTVQFLFHVLAGELKEALTVANHAIRTYEALGMFRLRGVMLANKATVLLDMEEVEAAEDVLRDSIKTAESEDNIRDISTYSANYALLEFERGNYDAAVLNANKAANGAALLNNRYVEVSARAIVGLAALEQGRITEANAIFNNIISSDFQFIGDDILQIEQFITKMLSREGRHDDALARLRFALSNKDGLSECCRKGLELQYASLIAKTDPTNAASLALKVGVWAKQRGARSLAKQAEELIR